MIIPKDPIHTKTHPLCTVCNGEACCCVGGLVLAAACSPLLAVGTIAGAANSALICKSILETRLVYDQVTDVRRVLDGCLEQHERFCQSVKDSLAQTNVHLQALVEQLDRIELKVDAIMDEWTHQHQQKLISGLNKTERAFRELVEGMRLILEQSLPLLSGR